MFGIRRSHREEDGRAVTGAILFRSLRDLFFPPRCHVCGAVFRTDAATDFPAEFARCMAPFLCPECREGFVPAGPAIPGSLLFRPRLLRQAHAVGRYESDAPFARAIRRYKYGGRVELAEPFGRLLRSAFQDRWAEGEIDVAAPVPLHPSKMRKRGYNQAYLLIRSWERTRPLGVRVDRDLLRRVRKTRSQAGLNAAEREENLRGAFRLRPGADVMGRRVLLVDDVLTTGATVGACAEVLRYAGAASVDVLTLGRTPGPSEDGGDGAD